MNNNMNPLVNYSPYGGQLILEEVKGSISGKINPENNVETVHGLDRDMYVYIPKSGCPHAKQCAVLMVYRDENTEESAFELMKRLKLDELSENRNFILLFPNPCDKGWNYNQVESQENDVQYLVRCFATLPKSKGKVGGFNGMIYHLATSEKSSAMVMRLSESSPLDAAAILVSSFPNDFQIVYSHQAHQVAWVLDNNLEAIEYLKIVNNVNHQILIDNVVVFQNEPNPQVKLFVSNNSLDALEVEKAWDLMFSETRRWRNSKFGTYYPRINFSEKGYIAQVNVDNLKVNNNFKHTWYEYVPENIKNSEEKVPLVLYFHGINCVGLYGAEQSGWSDLAEKDGFIVVYPEPAIEERWNVWDDPRLPSDVEFVLELIENLKRRYNIDEKRIYISGFSMGSIFSNALASSYPEIFAGVIACNGAHFGYLSTLEDQKEMLLAFRPGSVLKNIKASSRTCSKTKEMADSKKEKTNFRMPVVQCVGLLDSVGFEKNFLWPLTEDMGDAWTQTIKYWLRYNNISDANDFFDTKYESGISGDINTYLGENNRILFQSWKAEDLDLDLYVFMSVKDLEHAVVKEQIEIAWDFIKKFSREGNLLGVK